MSASKLRIRVGRALKPIVVIFAVLYFLIDALFFGLIKPFGTWLSKFRIFTRLGCWVRSLGPYSTLALFVIPFVALEPLKPIGLYLIASGRAIDGTLIIGVGEVLKITMVLASFILRRSPPGRRC